MAVVDSALLHINSGDLIALSDLMIPEAMVFPAQDQAGRGGSYTVRTVASQRATGKRAPIIERGYDPIVRLSGTIASVWMPYDLWAEIVEKRNVALAIVVGAMCIAIGLIVSAAVHG